MFTTLKLLGVVGGATFIGGNKMLAAIAAKRGNKYVSNHFHFQLIVI